MRKSIYSAGAICLAAAYAVAVPPVANPKSLVQETREFTYTSTGAYHAASANFTQILNTGFEAPDWQFGPSTYTGTSIDNFSLTNSVCGDQFLYDVCDTATGRCVRAPATVCATNAQCVDIPNNVVCTHLVSGLGTCLFKNHAANQNCCPDDAHDPAKGDPNPDTGWSMSPSGRHCRTPSIEDIHPFAGTQHLRFARDPLGGSPAGCTGTGSACRTRAITAQVGQPDISRSVWSMEIYWSNTLGSSMLQLTGQDTSVGSIYSSAQTYWYRQGGLYTIDFGTGQYVQVGYWIDHVGEYANFTADYNPCADKITLSYEGKCDTGTGFCVFTTTPCVTNADCTVPLEMPMDWHPPYGNWDADLIKGAVADTTFYTQENRASITDIDNHFVTYTPCTDACCDGITGLCADDVTALDCAGPSMHYYPNVTCAQLGTADKYPPACDRDTGSCCDAGPGAGGPGAEGSCTDGVLPEDCVGAQLTYTKNARCTPLTNAVCAIGHGAGLCAGALVGGVTEGFCASGFGKIGSPCEEDSDCDVAGFCYPGTCSAPALPGTCNYGGLGWCPDNLHLCNSDAECEGATELCDLFDLVGCAAVGSCPPATNGQFPAGDASLPQTAVSCDPNAPVGCASNADCTTPATGGVCVISVGNKGGDLCLSDADCNVPGTTCEEHTGSCCNTLAGTCEDGVLNADCQGPQRAWGKGTLCVDAGCSAVLGACCDKDPFGGCSDTTQAGCTCDKCEWSKLQSCASIECVHNAIPTVSEWGLVVLTLLLLTGAKVYFGRRQAVA